MVVVGSGAQRPLKTILMPRYACYLIVQNADSSKEIAALRQTRIRMAEHDARTRPLVGEHSCV
jgi:DNA-damage-inducible protein D